MVVFNFFKKDGSDKIQPDFCIRLKEERERLGLSISVFSEASGVRLVMQNYYEVGARLPFASYLQNISLIGCDVVYIICGTRSVKNISEIIVKNDFKYLNDRLSEEFNAFVKLKNKSRAELILLLDTNEIIQKSFENGNAEPTLDYFEKAYYLGFDIQYILTGIRNRD